MRLFSRKVTMADSKNHRMLRELWQDYKSEVFFFLILSSCVAMSHWLSRYISAEFMDNVLIPIQHGAMLAACAIGAWVLFRHAEGMRVRKAFAWTLVVWGASEIVFMLQHFVWHMQVFHYGNEALTSFMMLAGNFLGWLFLLYPTIALRPHWLNWKRGTMLLLPMVALVALDYMVPLDLRWLIAIYPAVLFALVLTHLRAYRIWCEENYSSMEHIDVQWIVRYLLMLLVVAVSYAYMMVSDSPTRAFTQNALLFFVFAYSTEQILFRRDPWENVQRDEVPYTNDDILTTAEVHSTKSYAAQRKKLERWMAKEKPYLRPDFQLMDLRAVLPMNRTYLSQFIRDEYGCSFYQFVTNYRMEEAKRLLREHPELTVEQVATRSGFSSRIVISRTFTKETGMSPREWSLQCNNK